MFLVNELNGIIILKLNHCVIGDTKYIQHKIYG